MTEIAAPSFANVAAQPAAPNAPVVAPAAIPAGTPGQVAALAAAPRPAAGPGFSLYIGDLHPDVSEAVLFEKFNPIGPVQSIRVCRDAITRRSLGYAYVNFTNSADAEKAMEALNFEEINGRQCRIMWSQRDPTARRSGVGNVFIKNLSKEIDNKTLYDTFEQFGKILSCKIATDQEGVSRGFAFVHYDTQEAAEAAISYVNGMELAGQQVYVGPFKSRRERLEQYAGQEKKFQNVYVKNLPSDYTEEQLDKLFVEFGEITSRKLVTDEDGKSKGFGFVAFKNHDDAKRAVDEMNGKTVGDKELYCGRAQKRAERLEQLRQQYEQRRAEMQKKYKGVNLYVKNLEESVDDDQLREVFSKIGNITSAKVMKDDKTGVSRGFGFVCFSSPEEATRAVTEMSGFLVGSKPLYVSLAQRKEERQQHLASQRMQRSLQMRSMPMPGVGMYGQQGPANMMYMQQMPPYAQRQYPAPMGAGRGGGRIYQGGAAMSQPAGYRAPMGGPQNRGGARQKGGRQGQQNPQYRQQVRNAPPAGAVPPQPQTAVNQPGQDPLTASALANATQEQQKQMLGERLYPLIQRTYPQLAGKITGMLLEMDNSELLHLLEDEGALNSKMQEAVEVLQEHVQQTGQQVEGLPPK